MEPNNTDVLDVSVTLRWNQPMDIDIASYRIEYRVKVDQSEWMVAIVDPPVTSYVITDLSPLTTYEVRIFAISFDDVTSVAADPLSVTTGGIFVVFIVAIFHYYHIIISSLFYHYNNVANSFYVCTIDQGICQIFSYHSKHQFIKIFHSQKFMLYSR